MGDKAKHLDELAVKELRRLLARYRGIRVTPDSRLARQLEAARKAVAGYEESQRTVATKRAVT
jgi:hypothetical protein